MESDKYKLNLALEPSFEALKSYFSEFAKDTLTNEDWHRMFALTLKATTIKSYEFCLTVINSRNDNIYFMLPTLRGICEEYITEKFIFDKATDSDERNFIITIWQQHGLLKSSISQWEYYKINKPNQILFYEESFPEKLKALESEIRIFFNKKFPNLKLKTTFPSVYYMAKETGLLEVYNYLYHATSTFVHFHPNNLFRMSWGNIPNMTYSTSNFKHYYNDFIIYYGAKLFCDLAEWQISNSYLDGLDKTTIQTIRESLNKVKRIPELVTFEEMNIGVLTRHLRYKSPDMLDQIS
jgi:hypothetical protein